MAVAANYIEKILAKFPWIMWIGLLIILFVALEMIFRGGFEVSCNMLSTLNCESEPIDLIKSGMGFTK